MKKKLFAWLLLTSLLLTLLPSAALADGPTAPTPNEGAELSVVTDWVWHDPDQALTDGVLVLSNVSMDAPKLWEEAAAALPTQITAQVQGESDPVTLELADWTCTDYDPSLPGDYTAVTSLADGAYTLGTGVPPLQIKIVLQGTGDGQDVLPHARNISPTGSSDPSSTGDFTVTGGTLGNDYRYADHTLTILSSTPITISGTTTADRIKVANGVAANIILNGVDITSSASPLDLSTAGASTITLAADTKNILNATNATGDSQASLSPQTI